MLTGFVGKTNDKVVTGSSSSNSGVKHLHLLEIQLEMSGE